MIKTHEGKAVFYTDSEHKNKISKKLEVFYNPKMKMNRDLTILFLKNWYKLNKKKLAVGLPLAGSGVRGIRFLLEAKEAVKSLDMNDYDKTAVKNMKKNLKLNKHKNSNLHYFIKNFWSLQFKDYLNLLKLNCNKVKANLYNTEANIFLLKDRGYDFIDLDPFGSPNKFLENSIRSLSRNGMLAVTATDTAALTGTYPKTTKWKYWAKTFLSSEKHEIALRILIRKVQLVGSQYEKALIPVFSYAKDHYYRVIFVCKKSKTEAAKILDNHKMYTPHFFKQDVGPLWVGQLQDKKILREMIKLSELHKDFLKLLLEEEKVNTVGFVDIHEYMKRKKKQGLAHNKVIEKLKSKGFKASRTHFSYKGIKTNSKKI